MVGVDSFACGKVIGLATSYSRSAWKPIQTFPVSLHGRPSAAATTLLILNQLVSYISSFSRYYSAPSFRMDASAGAGRTCFSSPCSPLGLNHESEDMSL